MDDGGARNDLTCLGDLCSTESQFGQSFDVAGTRMIWYGGCDHSRASSLNGISNSSERGQINGEGSRRAQVVPNADATAFSSRELNDLFYGLG